MAVVRGRLGGVVLTVRHAVRVLTAGLGLHLLGGCGLLTEVAEVHVGDGRLGGIVIAVGAGAVTVALAVVAGDSTVAVENRAGLLGGVVHAVAGAGAVAVREAELAHDRRGGGGEEEEGGSLHHLGSEKKRGRTGERAKQKQTFGRFLSSAIVPHIRTQARAHSHAHTDRQTHTSVHTLSKLIAFGCSWPDLSRWPTHHFHELLKLK